MPITGGCFCGALRYEITGAIQMSGLCFCKTCQTLSGGAGNAFIGLDAGRFRYVAGAPATFTHPAHENAPTREFCATCGTQISGRSAKAPSGMIVKLGTLDDPSVVSAPNMAFWVQEKQSFHCLPEGVKAYDSLPGC